MSTNTYRIPWTYWLDARSRCIVVGDVVRSNRSSVYVNLTDDEYAEVMSDATYYADAGTDVFGSEMRGVCTSAAATVRSLAKAAT